MFKMNFRGSYMWALEPVRVAGKVSWRTQAKNWVGSKRPNTSPDKDWVQKEALQEKQQHTSKRGAGPGIWRLNSCRWSEKAAWSTLDIGVSKLDTGPYFQGESLHLFPRQWKASGGHSVNIYSAAIVGQNPGGLAWTRKTESLLY